MSSTRLVAPLLAGLLLASCSSPSEPEASAWQATLSAVPPSTVTGSAAAVTQFGRTRTSIQIRRAVPGATYGWRIETGTCASPGKIQGGAAVYSDMTPGETGVASAEASLSALLESGAAYAVRAFRRAPEGEVIVACGVFEQVG